MQHKPNGLKINWWKWGFILLLSANLALMTVLTSRLLQKREVVTEQLQLQGEQDLFIGQFTTDREALNQLLAVYLEDYQTKDFSYQVFVGSTTILFEGAYQLFGYQIPLYVYFSPYQLEDGSVRLDIDSFSVGTLPLPAKEVLQYIESSYQLPDIVTISPKKETIKLNLPQLENTEDIYVKAKTIDLLNDQISFDLYKRNGSSEH